MWHQKLKTTRFPQTPATAATSQQPLANLPACLPFQPTSSQCLTSFSFCFGSTKSNKFVSFIAVKKCNDPVSGIHTQLWLNNALNTMRSNENLRISKIFRSNKITTMWILTLVILYPITNVYPWGETACLSVLYLNINRFSYRPRARGKSWSLTGCQLSYYIKFIIKQ